MTISRRNGKKGKDEKAGKAAGEKHHKEGRRHGREIDEPKGHHMNKKGSSSKITEPDYVKDNWDTNRNTEIDDPLVSSRSKKPGLIIPQIKKREKNDAIFGRGSGMMGRTGMNKNAEDLEDKPTANTLSLPSNV